MSNFRLKLKLDKQPPEPEEAFLKERPNKEKPPEEEDAEAWKQSGKVGKCHAFLEAYQETPQATSSYAKQETNYVVLGRGFAATVNLATLRSKWGRARTEWSQNTLRLIVVGHDDPWLHYVGHNMNQEVELLTLPGYARRPPLPQPAPQQRWLNSRVFSDHNKQEQARKIGGKGEIFAQRIDLRSGVKSISVRPKKGNDRYLLHLQDGSTLRANRVDICTGTGQQTYAEAGGERGIDMCQALWDEYLNPRIGEDGWKPRVSSAEMFVTGDRQVIAGGSVLITSANSPAGIQAGEHALCQDSNANNDTPADEVVLIASENMSGGFPPIGRLDSHARTAEGPLPMRVHHPVTAPLFPTLENVWYGEKYRVKSIELLNAAHLDAFCHDDLGSTAIDDAGIGTQLLVTFKPSGGARFVQGKPLGTDVLGAEPDLLYGLFDQVVISTGRARGGRKDAEKEEGSAMQLVWSFKDDLRPIEVSGYAFPVGLQTTNGRLRILGAAGINNPIYKADPGAKEFEKYESSIPWQGRVFGEGVTLAAKTIAIANRFFVNEEGNEDDYDVCVNTATLEELTRALGAEPARRIHAMRHWRVRPLMAKKEILRAAEYWLNYLWRLPADRKDELAALAATFVREVNDPVFLTDDVRWATEKEQRAIRNILPWELVGFGDDEIAGLLLRYADHITDAKSRDKIRGAP